MPAPTWAQFAGQLTQWLLPRSDVTVKAWYPTPAAMVAAGDASFAPGDVVEAGGYRYMVAASGATDHHLINGALVKFYVDASGLDTLLFDAWAPAKNGHSTAIEGSVDDAGVIDDVPKLNIALAYAASLGKRLFLSPGNYGQATTLVLPSGAWLDGGPNFGARLCSKNSLTGWQIETANFGSAVANAATDANGDFNALVPTGIAVTGIVLDGRYQSFWRTSVLKSTGHGMRVYARNSDWDVQIMNIPGIGFRSYGKGGNGPTPLRPGYARRVHTNLYIHQTKEEGLIWDGPGDQVIGEIFQTAAGARLPGSAAGQEDAGKVSSPTFGGTNGGYTDGCVFLKGAEIKFLHAWGNRGGRGVVQYDGRILADVIVSESNHFGGLRLEGGTGAISILKLHKTGGWVEDYIGAPGVWSTAGALFHDAGLSNENDSHVIGVLKFEDYDSISALKSGAYPAVEIGANSRWLRLGTVDISKRNVQPGNGITIQAGAAFWTIADGLIRHCSGFLSDGTTRSAGVSIAGGGRGSIRAMVEDCDVALRMSGTAPTLCDIDIEYRLDSLTQDGATACVPIAGNTVRANPGQKWNIRGMLGSNFTDHLRNGGTLTIATADAAGATIAPTHNRHLLTCQADGNYVVTNITAPGWARPGDRFQFSTLTGARDVTFTPTTGNIRCNAGTSRVLDTPSDRIEFEFDGTNFVETFFANNV